MGGGGGGRRPPPAGASCIRWRQAAAGACTRAPCLHSTHTRSPPPAPPTPPHLRHCAGGGGGDGGRAPPPAAAAGGGAAALEGTSQCQSHRHSGCHTRCGRGGMSRCAARARRRIAAEVRVCVCGGGGGEHALALALKPPLPHATASSTPPHTHPTHLDDAARGQQHHLGHADVGPACAGGRCVCVCDEGRERGRRHEGSSALPLPSSPLSRPAHPSPIVGHETAHGCCCCSHTQAASRGTREGERPCYPPRAAGACRRCPPSRRLPQPCLALLCTLPSGGAWVYSQPVCGRAWWRGRRARVQAATRVPHCHLGW